MYIVVFKRANRVISGFPPEAVPDRPLVMWKDSTEKEVNARIIKSTIWVFTEVLVYWAVKARELQSEWINRFKRFRKNSKNMKSFWICVLFGIYFRYWFTCFFVDTCTNRKQTNETWQTHIIFSPTFNATWWSDSRNDSWVNKTGVEEREKFSYAE